MYIMTFAWEILIYSDELVKGLTAVD